MAENTAKKYEFFGDVDKDFRGNVRSEYPAWYFESQVEIIKEERASQIRRIERGEIPPDHIPYAKQEIAQLDERVRSIEKSKPDLTAAEKENLHKCYIELAESISESMFTRSEMMMGTASANEEARRMVSPCVGLSPKLRALAKAMNVKMDQGGKVSRNGAIKTWKIIAKLIGEGSNVEALRRDKATVATGA